MPETGFTVALMGLSSSRFWAVAVLCLVAGCGHAEERPTTATATNLFAPTGMRINPVFSKVTDLTHVGHSDGVEVQLEFTDGFDDPTKASGKVLFELYEYRRDVDPRGKRVGGPWVFTIEKFAEQKEAWNSALRSYRFALGDPAIKPDESYVLSAIFELTTGGRFFDRIVLTGKRPDAAGENLIGLPLPKPTSQPAGDGSH